MYSFSEWLKVLAYQNQTHLVSHCPSNCLVTSFLLFSFSEKKARITRSSVRYGRCVPPTAMTASAVSGSVALIINRCFNRFSSFAAASLLGEARVCGRTPYASPSCVVSLEIPVSCSTCSDNGCILEKSFGYPSCRMVGFWSDPTLITLRLWLNENRIHHDHLPF